MFTMITAMHSLTMPLALTISLGGMESDGMTTSQTPRKMKQVTSYYLQVVMDKTGHSVFSYTVHAQTRLLAIQPFFPLHNVFSSPLPVT
jgi:hypothetical protein